MGGQKQSSERPMPGDPNVLEGHLIVTYRGDRFPWEAVSSFLAAGSAANARLLYLFDRTAPSDVRRRLDGAGLEVERMLSTGQLQFRAAEEHYLPNGTFDPRRQIESARRALTDATRDGFDGLRVVGEMGWTADRDVPTRTLADHERRVDELMRRERIQGLCVYPADHFDDAVIDVLSEMHDGVPGASGSGGAPEAMEERGSGAEEISRETTFRALPAALFHIQWPAGLIQACNAAAEEFTGYDRGDLVGSVLERLFSNGEEANTFRRRCRRDLQDDESARITLPIRHADGHSRPTEHVLTPLDADSARKEGPALLLMRGTTGE